MCIRHFKSALFALATIGGSLQAGGLPDSQMVDWSLVTLLGSGTQADPFVFDECRLGRVEVVYSNSQLAGVITNFTSEPQLGLGEPGAGPGVVTVSWSNPATALEVRCIDLDLSETDSFTIEVGTTLTLVRDNPLDGSDFLDGLVMRAGGGDLPNGSDENYSALRIEGEPFTSFSVAFNRPGGGSGGSAITFGNAQVIPRCLPDLDANCVLNFFDISRFIQLYNSRDPQVDFTGDGEFDFFDVSAFIGAFNAGCP
ncbi:MAG: GC-type dockerin domain-anchored protein [Phycisphaerales bacterium]